MFLKDYHIYKIVRIIWALLYLFIPIVMFCINLERVICHTDYFSCAVSISFQVHVVRWFWPRMVRFWSHFCTNVSQNIQFCQISSSKNQYQENHAVLGFLYCFMSVNIWQYVVFKKVHSSFNKEIHKWIAWSTKPITFT